MPHKVISPNVLRRYEEELSSINTSISRAKTIGRGDKDSFSALKEQLRDFLETARDKKNEAMDMLVSDDKTGRLPADSQDNISKICRGQEKAFEIILDLMENPTASVSYYENQKKQVEEELKRMQQIELRPS